MPGQNSIVYFESFRHDGNMNKSLLVVFPSSMQIGGIEKSFIGLLNALSELENCETDVFVYGHHGELFPYITSEVNIFPEVKELAYLQQSIKSKILHGCYYASFQRVLCEIEGKDFYEFENRVRKRKAPKLSKNYDLAISFCLPFDFLSYNVKAKVKIGWIHTDYSSCERNTVALKKQYAGLDYIAAVSNSVADTFKEVFPELADKVIVIENILPVELVKSQSKESITDMPADNSIRLLSVGRFCEAKNFDNVPEICSLLVASGLDVKWYLIGFGGYEELIRRKIAEFDMEERVIILGKKENPYPYMAQCDLYVQPSRYEGKAVTVREAQTLGKPVVITDFPTAKSQLRDGIDGIIVPMDNEGCADGIAGLLRDKEKIRELSENCLKHDYSNADEIIKIDKIITNTERREERHAETV